MTKQEIIAGYVRANKPFEVCAHTRMGGSMEFMTIERGIMFEENAKQVADSYAHTWGKSENVKSVCVRKDCVIVYEVEI